MIKAETRLKSFAKLNLGLEITGRRPDGYHLLRTIFQTIALHDVITVNFNRGMGLRISGTGAEVDWSGRNTIRSAVELFVKTYDLPCDLDIKVKKNIPAGAGLGGGSSNAAVMLLFLNEHSGRRRSPLELLELAMKIGADVPYFLFGGRVLGQGIGEKLTFLPDGEDMSALIAFSPLVVDTGKVFQALTLTKKPGKSKILSFIKEKDFSKLENDLEKTSLSLFPELGEVKKKMIERGFNDVLMTGSGSAFFVLRRAQEIKAERDRMSGLQCFALLSRQEYLNKIGVWPSGKASVFGADIRRFESSHPRWPHE